MHNADRIRNLGTETAFAVAAKAAAHAASGGTVYPFHLGDLNIATPQNVRDAADRAMAEGKTGYCPPAGIAPLRDALAQDTNAKRGTSYSMENVSVQPGGKPVISKFLLALMNPGDEVLCPNPGFPIYESQIEFLGGKVLPYPVIPAGDYFTFDLDALEKAITPKTKLLIVNDYHNPTGAECSASERERLAEIAVRNNLTVLLDEAYFETHYDQKANSIVSLPGMVERSVLLYTFSKKFAMTGWRLGAAIGPREIIDIFNKINVNVESCTCQFVQWAGLEGLTGDQSGPKKIVDTLRERRDAAVDILNSIPGISCIRPNASFYLYPDVTEVMQRKGFGDDYDAFAEDILKNTGVSFCTRLHFGRPLPGETRRYIRLAFSGIDTDAIRAGLGGLKQYLS
ncbi:aminotransferase class I/II-fold pyridoxal phosphate-dependent enzyme [Desulfovibrio sp. OttesenSCG-928-O18]|nr:aminotransferase class I/II-fold pyridoxal phosphate-dependent enzyme [Desulfovibrio sp. OttesenSCG-928-O18]